MFLTEPERTQFDWNWRLFGIDVRVHPWFWLAGAFLGWSTLDARLGGGLGVFAVWMGCFFFSILLHELGHVTIGRVFGAHGRIVLYGFGGLAVGSSALANRWQRIAVYLAGPGAELVFFGLIWLGHDVLLPLRGGRADVPRWVEHAYDFLFWINLYWGLLNLVPIWPLDGGQISRDFLGWLLPGRGTSVALGVSFLLAALLAINSLAEQYDRPLLPFRWVPTGGWFFTLFFAMLALGSYQAMQQVQATRRFEYQDEYRPWERDPDRWKR